MIRTGIYVYEQTSVSIKAPYDRGGLLFRFGDPASAPAAGAHHLKPGIYQVVSDGEIQVLGDHFEVVTLREEKDPLPVPKVQALKLEPGASYETLKLFFAVAKDADPPYRPEGFDETEPEATADDDGPA